MQRINHNNWVKGKSYQKRILIKELKEKINLIEDVIVVPKGEIPCHSHDFTDEIFYIINNSAIMIVNNKEFKVNPGDMIYVDKNESHGFRNKSDKEFKMIVFKINFQEGDSLLS
ncbi:MAG: cupin domain-containing protein [Candidatus Andersenbacteria bacterium]|nr:cupin domain-containing protein [Candidatus Andersenbacteria bacterium]